MTRTHVDESELMDIERNALDLFCELAKMEAAARDAEKHNRAEKLLALADLARELSDQVDTLCEFIRHGRMVDKT